MNVRKSSVTTVSLLILYILICLAISMLYRLLPHNLWFIISQRVYSIYFIGIAKSYSLILKSALWLIIITGTLDAILRNRIALSVIISHDIPFFLAVPALIIAFTLVNTYMFWGFLYILSIIGIYLSFRKMIGNNYSQGQTVFTFLKNIRRPVQSGNDYILNRLTVWITSATLVLFFFILLISFGFYVSDYWALLV